MLIREAITQVAKLFSVYVGFRRGVSMELFLLVISNKLFRVSQVSVSKADTFGFTLLIGKVKFADWQSLLTRLAKFLDW